MTGTRVILLLLMSTIQADLTNSLPLTRLSSGPTLFMNDKWDSSFIKKFVTAKWPYEVYERSILGDLWLVLTSPLIKKRY